MSSYKQIKVRTTQRAVESFTSVLTSTHRKDPSVMDFTGGWVGCRAGLLATRKR
jgi:hypothetical protein